MAQVDLYARIAGQKWERYFARMDGVQDALEAESQSIGVRARAALVEHKHDGHSYIEVRKARKIDRLVILNDLRGQAAAMSIEFGRGPNLQGKDAMTPLYILHKAAGARPTNTFPRRPRKRRRRKRR